MFRVFSQFLPPKLLVLANVSHVSQFLASKSPFLANASRCSRCLPPKSLFFGEWFVFCADPAAPEAISKPKFAVFRLLAGPAAPEAIFKPKLAFFASWPAQRPRRPFLSQN